MFLVLRHGETRIVVWEDKQPSNGLKTGSDGTQVKV